jgi:RNA polymerase sigma-70 factor, ECF subfamily
MSNAARRSAPPGNYVSDHASRGLGAPRRADRPYGRGGLEPRRTCTRTRDRRVGSRIRTASPGARRSKPVSTAELVDVGGLRQRIARVVDRVCPTWLSAQRDDLVQSALMRVMQLLNSRSSAGEGSDGFSSSYLYKVAHSALVDEIRRVRRRRETDLEGDAVEDVAVTTLDPEQLASSTEIGSGIQGCLQQMKEERRLAVTLYLQGHTVVEASRILEWSAKRTENLVYRGLADLRACLTSKGLRP